MVLIGDQQDVDRTVPLRGGPAECLRQPVDDLGQAVQLIGRASVESALIVTAVGDALPLGRDLAVDLDRFWSAAGLRASIASAVAERICPSERSLCWTGALLQDLALPLLAEALGDRWGEAVRKAAESDRPLHEVEHETFGWDHADIGGAIAASWELPEVLVEAIAGHHADAADGGESAIPVPVRLVAVIGIEGQADEAREEVLAEAERLGVEPDLIEEAVARGIEDAEHFTSLIHG